MNKYYNGLQSKLEQIGEYGCYFLSIMAACDYDGGIVDFYDYCVSKKWITEDCEVLRPDLIAHEITGKNYKVTKSDTKPEDCAFYVIKYHNDRTGYSHFRLPDIDTLKDSITVKEGYPESYRVFQEV